MRDFLDGEARQALEEGERLIRSGDLTGALRLFAQALPRNPFDAALLTAAADAWVAAVDGATLPDWSDGERHSFQRALILQQGCAVSPPIFHHRIAAQHSGGVAGHLARAAAALEPTLEPLLARGEPHGRTVLMALLLRDGFRRIDQRLISRLHHANFAKFSEGDLRIPYSVIFDRVHFRRNVADLSDYVRTRRDGILDGALPVHHLLLLFWLVPREFDRLPADWSVQAVRARLRSGGLDDHEAAAARSLAIRFDGEGHRALLIENASREGRKAVQAMDAVAAARNALPARDGGRSGAAPARLDQRPHQALAAAWNMAVARLPRLARLRRRPRVAVCISGQLRGYKQAWKSWRPFLAGVDATVFVSSWTRIGRGNPEPFRVTLPFQGEAFSREYRAIGAEIGFDGLRGRYPSLFAALDSSASVTEAEVSAVYGTPHVELHDERDAPFDALTNPEKMYLKIERCFRMMEASGAEFDLVLRIRPDKPVAAVAFDWAGMAAAVRDRPLLYCEAAMGVHYGALLIGDQFAIGAPGASRVYADTWSRSDELRQLDLHRLDRHFNPHTTMAYVCWLHGVEIRKVPIKFGHFQDAEPLAANEIREALARDGGGRMDAFDLRLIAANREDRAKL